MNPVSAQSPASAVPPPEASTLARSLLKSAGDADPMMILLESIGRSAPVGFKLVDRDMRIVLINEFLAGVGGLRPEACIGRTVAELWPDVWRQVSEPYRRALHGETVQGIEVSVSGPQVAGKMHHELASYYPVWIDGKIVGVGNVVLDITDRKEAEEAQKLLTQAAVDAIAAIVEARDPYTAGHQRRVADIAVAIARELGLADDEIEGIRVAATIHDVGKIAIPSEILTRPGRLSKTELELVKEHPHAGGELLAGIEFPWPVATMVAQHHERFDGSGYPDGLRGNEISVGARIIAVADVVEAMSSHRPYRPARGLDEALREIERGRGDQFDPAVVDACLSLFGQDRDVAAPATSGRREATPIGGSTWPSIDPRR